MMITGARSCVFVLIYLISLCPRTLRDTLASPLSRHDCTPRGDDQQQQQQRLLLPTTPHRRLLFLKRKARGQPSLRCWPWPGTARPSPHGPLPGTTSAHTRVLITSPTTSPRSAVTTPAASQEGLPPLLLLLLLLPPPPPPLTPPPCAAASRLTSTNSRPASAASTSTRAQLRQALAPDPPRPFPSHEAGPTAETDRATCGCQDGRPQAPPPPCSKPPLRPPTAGQSLPLRPRQRSKPLPRAVASTASLRQRLPAAAR